MNGYDLGIISDGLMLSGPNQGMAAFYSRIDPSNPTIVEFALDYTKLGLSMSDIAGILYLDMQSIKGDPKDPQNYFWNDKYNQAEAGAPYFDPGGFGKNGLGAIYELDTVRVGVIPGPGALFVLIGGLVLLARRRR